MLGTHGQKCVLGGCRMETPHHEAEKWRKCKRDRGAMASAWPFSETMHMPCVGGLPTVLG